MSVGPLDGLITGLNTSQLIQQLMSVDKIPQQQLQNQQSALTAENSAWDDIAGKLATFRTASDALAPTNALSAVTAASSDSTIVRATASAGATAGSLILQVTSLASAHQLASAGFASTSSLVGAGTVTLSSGASGLGFSHLSADGTVAAGSSTVTVSAASAAATLTGTAATTPVVISAGSNDTLSVTVNGVVKTATLTAGSYSSLDPIATQLASQLGPDATVSVVNGALQVSSSKEGSTATLTGVGGTAATDLGLAGLAGASATGTDGLVSFGGTQVSVSDTSAGGTVTVGGLTLTLTGGHLSAGSAAVTTVRTTASTTLSDLASAINSAGGSVRASAIATGSNGSNAKLVLSASQTGVVNAMTVDTTGLTSLSGGFTTLRSAADAVVTMGSGPGAITVTRPTNTITDLMPGVTLDLAKAAPGTDVTVSTSQDVDGLTAKAKSFVDGLNGLLTSIKGYTSYDAKAKKAGVLLGDSRARALVDSIFRDLQGTLGSGTVRSLSQMGIQTTKDGTFTFDAAAFGKALKTDPTSVSALLSRKGTSTDSRLSFIAATSSARSGNPAVTVTQAAAQAAVDSSAFGTLTGPELLTVTQGGKTVTFTAPGGSDANAVASGLQAAFAASGLSMSATVVSGAVHLATTGYGSAASFSVQSDQAAGAGTTGLGGATPNTPTTHAGLDVQASVGGVATTGIGQAITAATGTGTGITMLITANAADVAAAGGSLALGSLAFSGGAAGSLSQLLADAVSSSGTITTAKQGNSSAIDNLQKSIDDWDIRLADSEARYRKQFADLETMIGQLRSQQSQLASQLGSLGSSSGG